VKTTRVYRKGNRWYYVADLEQRNPRTGRPIQKWHALTRVDEGDAALLKKVAELIGETPKRQGNMVAFISEFQAVHFKTLTFEVEKEYERMFGVIGKAFAEFDAHQIAPGDVVKFLNDNFADKHTTKGHYKARLSTFFSWCVLNQERTGVRINPCREIKLKSPPKSRGKMNAVVYWRIYDALSPMGQCFLELMYLTRQRPTEIRLLRESQIGPERIHFRPTKTEESSGEEVDVLITPEIQAALERARALRPKRKIEDLAKHRDPFIIQARDGDKYTKNGIYEVWRDACVAAKASGVTTRHVRPFALYEMERLGYDVREIQRAAAHASITTTEGYLDQHRDRLSDARLPLPPRKT
jgi:integrase